MSDKFKINIPKFDFPDPTPRLNFLKTGNPEQREYRLIFEQLNDDMKRYFDSKLNATNEALEKQLDLAKAEAESAKRDARFSKIVSSISIVIAIAAIVIPLIIT